MKVSSFIGLILEFFLKIFELTWLVFKYFVYILVKFMPWSLIIIIPFVYRFIKKRTGK